MSVDQEMALLDHFAYPKNGMIATKLAGSAKSDLALEITSTN